MQFSILFTTLFVLLFTTLTNAAPLVERGSMSGKATYYTPGLGSCGKTNSESDMVVALSSSDMSKSLCGKSITVKSKTGSVTVKVVDTCPGCGSGSVDLSPSAFAKIGTLSAGVIPITWS
jgi:expansin (peptidoglycan-binding protein)